MPRMTGITVKVPAGLARRLKDQARTGGRSVSALIREKLEHPSAAARSVNAIAGDLAGCLAGRGEPATNQRRKFRRS